SRLVLAEVSAGDRIRLVFSLESEIDLKHLGVGLRKPDPPLRIDGFFAVGCHSPKGCLVGRFTKLKDNSIALLRTLKVCQLVVDGSLERRGEKTQTEVNHIGNPLAAEVIFGTFPGYSSGLLKGARRPCSKELQQLLVFSDRLAIDGNNISEFHG